MSSQLFQSPAYQVTGLDDSIQFAFCSRLIELLQAALQVSNQYIKVESVTKELWPERLKKIIRIYGFQQRSQGKDTDVSEVIVFNPVTGRFIGGAMQLEDDIRTKYGIECDLAWQQIQVIPKENSALDVKEAPRKPAIIIAGPPAGGKGTQCELIKEKLGIIHISTGDLLRDHVKRGTTLGKTANKYMSQGHLVPDNLMIDMVKDRMNQADVIEHGWLLDGFPRTYAQAVALLKANVKVDKFLLLCVPESLLVERVCGRRLDPETGIIYHMKFKPPSDDIMDRLIQRSDDTAEKVKTRISTYEDNIKAVASKFNDCLITLNGDNTPDVVFERICQALGCSDLQSYIEE